jgi:glycerate 2-kinase
MRDHLTQMFQAGIDACHPKRVLPGHLPPTGKGRTIVLAIGKAAAEMAAVAEAHYPDATGLAVAPHGTEARLRKVDLLHAGHPVPDLASVTAGNLLLALAHGAGTDDLVLVLLSGGASALACAPADGMSLTAKQNLVRTLLQAGAPIADINCVRRHVSAIKGGRLALAAAPAHLVTLAISDVTGGPEDIGSGPTLADPTTNDDARKILERHGLDAPLTESPKRVDGEFRIVASADDALRAVAAEAERLGYRPVMRGQCTGEARDVGRAHAQAALDTAPGTALISGGELTVTVSGPGRGGPNTEYALAASLALAGREDIAGLAADSDGLDGTSGSAGAFIAARSDGEAALAANDSASAVDLFVTGPTGTNVSDLRILLVGPRIAR